MNIKKLEKLGLSGKKAKIYLAVLELGRATAIDIAKRTRIKRTTVYDVVLELMQDGYLSESKRGARRIFIAEDPGVLVGAFENRLNEVKEIAPELLKIYTEIIPKPQLRFYDGFNGVRRIMEELLNMRGKEQLFWSSITDLLDVLGNRYLQSWVRRRIKRKIWSRCLLTKKSVVPDLYLKSNESVLREIRILPQTFVFDGVLCVFDNKVAYISSRKELFGFVIESNEFSALMRLIFRSAWNTTTS